MVILVGDEFACGEVGSAEQNPVDVLMTPHDALGEPGGAAGVEQVDVVCAAFTEITDGRTLGDGLVELHPAVTLVVQVAAVLDHQDGLDAWDLRQHIGDPVGVLPLVHQCHHVGVVEQVTQFALDIAVVDVDQDRPGFDDAQHRNHDLDAIAAVQAHLVVLGDPMVDQVVGQPVGLLFQLGEGDLLVTADQRNTVRDGIDGVLGEIGDIEGHDPKLERVTFFLNWRLN